MSIELSCSCIECPYHMENSSFCTFKGTLELKQDSLGWWYCETENKLFGGSPAEFYKSLLQTKKRRGEE